MRFSSFGNLNNEKEDLNLFLNENHKKLIEPLKIIIKDYELTNQLTDFE